MARYINRYTEQKGRCVLALGAGVSTHRAYASLIKLYNEGRVDFSNVIIYIIDEFFPLLPEGPSVLKRLREILLDHINIKPENVRTINPEITKETMYEYCQAYEQAIADDGGIDLAVFEIGPHGTVAFNEAGSPESSYCRLVLLGNEIRHIISKNYNCDEVPTTAITLGVANLRSAKRILTMAWGENSAEIVRKVVEGDASPSVPASLLQGHPPRETRYRPRRCRRTHPHKPAVEGDFLRMERQAYTPRHRMALQYDRQAYPQTHRQGL